MSHFCTECGATLDGIDRFCTGCGHETASHLGPSHATAPTCYCQICAAPTPIGAATCDNCAAPVSATAERLHPESAPPGRPHPVAAAFDTFGLEPGPRRNARMPWLVAGLVVVVLAAVGAGIAAATLTSSDDDPEVAVVADEAPVERDERAGNDDRLAADSPAGERGDDGFDEATPAPVGSPSPSSVLEGPGYTIKVPSDPEWTIGPSRPRNEGRQLNRRIEGPDGAVILIVHTPAFEAEPDPALVTGSSPLAGSPYAAERITLSDFPTPECEGRLCDDFVLNDPAFGGMAILANGTGTDLAAAAAEQMALSVTTPVGG